MFWLTLFLFAARQIRPALAPKLKGVTRLLVVLTVGSGAALGLQAAHFSNQTAVVISSEADARSGPFADAQTVFSARDGAELSVLDRHGDWLQVSAGPDKIGWLQKSQAEVLPGA